VHVVRLSSLFTTKQRVTSLLLPAAMVELDGDDIRISSRGKLAERDIVQVRHAAAIILMYLPHVLRG